MSILDRFFTWNGNREPVAVPARPAPRASFQDSSGGMVIRTARELEQAIRTGAVTASGATVTPDTAMRVAAVYACVRLIAGVIATVPLQIKRRVDDRTRQDATDVPIWRVINRRPNKWQKPHQFKRMMQAHVLLRGNAYAFKTLNSKGEVISLIPLHPDRVECRQLNDMSLEYVWTRKDGGRVVFRQEEILHLYVMTFDGYRGVSAITYAREAIGLASAMEKHGAAVFKNGANVSGALRHKEKLSPEAHSRLKDSMEEFRTGGARDGQVIILEEDMQFEKMAMSSADAEWLESRKFSRSDICMFFGVPPSIIGDNTGSDSNWGTGLEQKNNGFRAYCVEDYFVMWEEGVTADCIDEERFPDLYARFNRNAMVRSDLKSRWDAYTKSLQWGVMSPNEIRELEDENPREGGDIFYPPPNTAGKGKGEEDPDDDASKAA